MFSNVSNGMFSNVFLVSINIIVGISLVEEKKSLLRRKVLARHAICPVPKQYN